MRNATRPRSTSSSLSGSIDLSPATSGSAENAIPGGEEVRPAIGRPVNIRRRWSPIMSLTIQTSQPNEGQFLPTRRNGEEGKSRSLDHAHGLAGLAYMDVITPVMELDQELNRQDRGCKDIPDDVVLRSFDIKLQDIDMLQLKQRQNRIVSHHVAYDVAANGSLGGEIAATVIYRQ